MKNKTLLYKILNNELLSNNLIEHKEEGKNLINSIHLIYKNLYINNLLMDGDIKDERELNILQAIIHVATYYDFLSMEEQQIRKGDIKC